MKVFWWLVALAIAAAAGGALFVLSGVYDVSSIRSHWRITYELLHTVMKNSVATHARDIRVPNLDDATLVAEGRERYLESCARCHGAPGIAPEPFALGFTPAAPNLSPTGAEWKPEHIYWVVENGIKMTAMPAWRFRMSEHDMWAVVAYVRAMPRMTPEKAHERASVREERAASPSDPDRGRVAVRQYGCPTCHEIPGVVGEDAPVGPPLRHVGSRTFIAGTLPNNPRNLAGFLQDPQRYKPGGAMPRLGVTERDARDMAAWLGTLR